MTECQVVFLEMPKAGQFVQFIIDGRTATSSLIVMVEPLQQGWYRIFTQTGSVYTGAVQSQQSKPKGKSMAIGCLGTFLALLVLFALISPSDNNNVTTGTPSKTNLTTGFRSACGHL